MAFNKLKVLQFLVPHCVCMKMLFWHSRDPQNTHYCQCVWCLYRILLPIYRQYISVSKVTPQFVVYMLCWRWGQLSTYCTLFDMLLDIQSTLEYVQNSLLAFSIAHVPRRESWCNKFMKFGHTACPSRTTVWYETMVHKDVAWYCLLLDIGSLATYCGWAQKVSFILRIVI